MCLVVRVCVASSGGVQAGGRGSLTPQRARPDDITLHDDPGLHAEVVSDSGTGNTSCQI